MFASQIYQNYAPFFVNSNFLIENIGTSKQPLPSFNEATLVDMYDEAIDIIRKQPSLLNLSGKYIVVGDLHGNFLDLIRIFQKCGNPSYTNYIFLGDYVDRGDFSLDVITLLFACAILFPKSFYLLRGNHECIEINKDYGFYDEIISRYSSETLFNKVNDVFDYLPIAAVINGSFFLVHGGISQYYDKLKEINNLKRPLRNLLKNPAYFGVLDLLWSDPCQTATFYTKSGRGNGHIYGSMAVKSFLVENHLKAIIRAHEFTSEGFSSIFSGEVYTVFSSSNYRINERNCAAAIILEEKNICPCYIAPMSKPRRENTTFQPVFIKRSLAILKTPYVRPPGSRKLSDSELSKQAARSLVVRQTIFRAKAPLIQRPQFLENSSLPKPTALNGFNIHPMNILPVKVVPKYNTDGQLDPFR